MASLSVWHWLIVYGVVILIFCTRKILENEAVPIIRNAKNGMSFPIWFHVAVASILLWCLLLAAKMLTAQ
jgi:hypothetical protein